MTTAAPIPDGAHDAIVVDATASDNDTIVLELTLIDGAHKGHVVEIATTDVDQDPLFLLGTPATITVVAGVPRVELEP